MRRAATRMSNARGGLAVLILAGTKPGEPNRALIPLQNRPMLDYVVDALTKGMAQAAQSGELLIAGDNIPLPSHARAVPGGANLTDTLLNGVAALRNGETRLLVATADIPFLTPASVADFLHQADACNSAQFIYPLVSADLCRAQYPQMRRTTLRIAEGEFTGGNLVLLDPAFLRANENLLRDAYSRRKSVVALANLLGVPFFLRLALSRIAPALLTIPHVEAAVGRALGGAKARAVISRFPELAADLDRPEDILLAEAILSSTTQLKG